MKKRAENPGFTFRRRVHYYETDQMAIVHHANYIRWLEEARTAWMTHVGVSYRSIEAEGIQIPVSRVEGKYHTPALFDDAIEIDVSLAFYNGIRAIFRYEVYAMRGEAVLLFTGESEHCYMDVNSHRPQNLKKRLPWAYEIFARVAQQDAGGAQ